MHRCAPAAGSPPPAGLRGVWGRVGRQAVRFVLVALLCGTVDWSVYQLGLAAGVWLALARAVSFLAGTTLAYTLNRRWTFATDRRGPVTVAKFALLYATTFAVILALNAAALAWLPATWWRITTAWAVSQWLGTSWNFFVLRTRIFTPPTAAAGSTRNS